MIKAVIFDVDGTLMDSNDLHVEAAAKAGMQTVGLLGGGFTQEALRAAGAVAVFRDVSDLLERYDESPLAAAKAAAMKGRA